VISTMSAPFCSTCNRMRLAADGKMKNCLFSKEETDLLTALREGKDITALIRENVWNKAEERGGQFVADFNQLDSEHIQNRSMIAIGG
jgi:GTP 3',8-cyclase